MIVDERINENITETFKLRPASDQSGEETSPIRSLSNKAKSPPATLKDYINRYVEKKLNIARDEVQLRT